MPSSVGRGLKYVSIDPDAKPAIAQLKPKIYIEC